MITIVYLCYIKGPIIIFHLNGHAVKLKCVNYKISEKRDFCNNNNNNKTKQNKTKQNKTKKNKKKKTRLF